MKIILASSSPRRQDLLKKLGVDFTSISPDIDETVVAGELPYGYVLRLARQKALEVAKSQPIETIVIGGDVTIDVDGASLAKAETPEEAESMLWKLSGRSHWGRDAYAIVYQGEVFYSGVVSVKVNFRDISQSEMAEYISTNEWVGKAAAYAIQGQARKFVTSITGSYFDILGFPVFQVAAGIETLGVKIDSRALESLRFEDKSLSFFNN